jgi:hypothetical protein
MVRCGFGSRGAALGRVILESVGLSTYDTRPNVKFKLDVSFLVSRGNVEIEILRA